MNAYQPVLDFAANPEGRSASLALLRSQRRLIVERRQRLRGMALVLLAVMAVIIGQLCLSVVSSYGLVVMPTVEFGSRVHLVALLLAALVVTMLGVMAWRSQRTLLQDESQRLYEMMLADEDRRASRG